MSGPSANDGAAAWFTARRFAVVLALLIVAAFPAVTFGLQTFVHRDFGLFGYPLAFHHRESFWNGELPLWNPYNNLGVPHLAQWNTLVLYPGSLIYLLLPLPWSLNLFCLAHLFLGGLGMHRLAERWTGNRLAAAVAGAAFAFNGLTLNALMWPNNIAALGWMPWVVWRVEQGWRDGGRSLLLGALVGCLQMLAGAPEITLFTWLLLGVMWTGQWLRRSRPGWVLFRRGLALIVLVAGLSAAQMLPFLDLLRHSHRDAGFANGAWAMPIWGWANFLVPGFHMLRSGSGLLYQPSQFWTSSYYVPIGVTVLALGAVTQLRQPRTWLLALTLLGSLVLALGDGGLVYRWLREVFPAANFMRFPIKCVVLAVFILPVLAALALADRRTEPGPGRPSSRVVWPAIVAAVVLGMAMIVGWAWAWPMNTDDWDQTWRSGLSRLGWLALFLLALRWTRTAAGGLRLVAGPLLALIVICADALTHTAWQNPTVSPDVFGPAPVAAREMPSAPALGRSRAMLSLGAMEEFYRKNSPDAAAMLGQRRVALMNNLNLLERLPKVDGFMSLYLPEERALHFRLYTSDREVRPGLADLLGAGQVTCSKDVLSWSARPTALPWVTAGQQPAFGDRTAALNALLAPGFNPRDTLWLPTEAAGVVPTNRAEARVLSTSWGGHRVEAEVEAAAPAVVLFSQAHYHPWQATVDGVAARIWRANVALQAVVVPAGRHRIELRYRDRAWQLGLGISLLSLGGVLVGWWRARMGA